jgi:hypothetical protein
MQARAVEIIVNAGGITPLAMDRSNNLSMDVADGVRRITR